MSHRLPARSRFLDRRNAKRCHHDDEQMTSGESVTGKQEIHKVLTELFTCNAGSFNNDDNCNDNVTTNTDVNNMKLNILVNDNVNNVATNTVVNEYINFINEPYIVWYVSDCIIKSYILDNNGVNNNLVFTEISTIADPVGEIEFFTDSIERMYPEKTDDTNDDDDSGRGNQTLLQRKIHRLLQNTKNDELNFANRLRISLTADFYGFDNINGNQIIIVNARLATFSNTLGSVRLQAIVFHRKDYEDVLTNYAKYAFDRYKIVKTFVDDIVDNNDYDFKFNVYHLTVNTDDNDQKTSHRRRNHGDARPITYGAVTWSLNSKPMDGRTFSSIYLPDTDLDKLRKDFEKFFHRDTVAWYKKRNMPRKRIYLFHGRPGTGKSSLIKCIASTYDYGISVLKLDNHKMNDTVLRDAFSSIPRKTILVIEEIDTFFANRDVAIDKKTGQSVSQRINNMHNSVTFGGLLDMIDGMIDLKEQIVIMTTNHIDRLDHAQLRPGRVDFILAFNYIAREQVTKMTSVFYDTDSAEDINNFVAAYVEKYPKSTPANLQGIFIYYHDKALAEITKLIKTNKIDAVIDTYKNHSLLDEAQTVYHN